MHVRKRPHAEHFLREVAKRFEIIIFTASERPYAENVLSQLDPHGSLIDYVLCREDCLFIEGEFVKDLNSLGRDLRRVALVDNRPEMYCFQVSPSLPLLQFHLFVRRFHFSFFDSPLFPLPFSTYLSGRQRHPH